MASDVDICNLALSHLGDEAGVVAIEPPDGTQQAAYCGTYYPMARDVLLEAHPWPFAVKRATLAEITNVLDSDWGYAYTLPTGCMRPLAALLPGVGEQLLGNDTDNGSHPYIVEAADNGSLVLYTNVETAQLRYIAKVTDPAKWSPSFVSCLARLLSSYLAGPILKGEVGMKVSGAQLQIFEREYAKATANAANIGKRNTYATFTPSHLAARGLSMQVPDARITRP